MFVLLFDKISPDATRDQAKEDCRQATGTPDQVMVIYGVRACILADYIKITVCRANISSRSRAFG